MNAGWFVLIGVVIALLLSGVGWLLGGLVIKRIERKGRNLHV